MGRRILPLSTHYGRKLDVVQSAVTSSRGLASAGVVGAGGWLGELELQTYSEAHLGPSILKPKVPALETWRLREAHTVAVVATRGLINDLLP